MIWFSVKYFFEIFLILRRKVRDMIKNVYWSSRKLSVFPVPFQLNFSRHIFEKYNQISWKSLQWEPSCSRGQRDGQTDLTKLIVAFRSFVNSPKKRKCEKKICTKNSGGIEFRHSFYKHYLNKREACCVDNSCILQVTLLTQFMDLAAGILFQKYNFLENNYEIIS